MYYVSTDTAKSERVNLLLEKKLLPTQRAYNYLLQWSKIHHTEASLLKYLSDSVLIHEFRRNERPGKTRAIPP